MTSLTLTLPDDWHIHLRDGAALATTVPDVARMGWPRHRDAEFDASGADACGRAGLS
jgi:hypothetical protein